MKRSIALLAIIMLLAVSSTLANRGPYGQRPGGPMHCMKGDDFIGPGMLLRSADEIGLDEKQQAKISGLMEEFGLARIELKAELEKAELKLRHLKMNDGPEKDIFDSMDKVGALKTEMQKMRYRHRKTIKSVLTQEQLDKLKELRHKYGRGDGPGCHGRGAGPGGDSGPKHGGGPGPQGDGSRWRR